MSEQIVKKPTPKRKRLKKSDKLYVDNAKFTEGLQIWIEDLQKEAEIRLEKKKEKARSLGKKEAEVSKMVVKLSEVTRDVPLPTFVSECIYKISIRYANKPNFSGYTFIDDMKSEAMLACVKYAHNFNPSYSNAFAYFTTIVHRSFLQYLKKENTFAGFKFKLTAEELDNSEKYDYNNVNLTKLSDYHKHNGELIDIELSDEEHDEYVERYQYLTPEKRTKRVKENATMDE